MTNRVGSHFLKGGHLAFQMELKCILYKHKVKHQRNSDTKTCNREPYQNHRVGTVSMELMRGGGVKPVQRIKPHPRYLPWLFYT